MKNLLQELDHIEHEITLLNGMGALLSFDQETQMPSRAVHQRADQNAYVSTKIHDIFTSDKLSAVVNGLAVPKVFAKLTPSDKARITKLQKEIKKAESLPSSFIKKLAHHQSLCFHAWEEARKKNDFKVFQSKLDTMIKLQKEKAKYIDPEEHPYNVLLEDFEEGMTKEKIGIVLHELKAGLLGILDRLRHKQKPINVLEQKVFLKDGQIDIANDLKKRMLMEEDRSILSFSTHPFTTRISKDDVRITTAVREHQPLFSLTSTMHEAGHALYELGFPEKYANTILYDAPSYGLHESQSRFWELFIGLSKEFWKGYFPIYQRTFPTLKMIPLDEFYETINEIKPSAVRIESDEIHYCLHIIIRFEIEVALMEGKLKTKDLPAEWNSKYHRYLGITPKNVTEGVLQDVHWAQGYFGYFPTYALGTLYAAMLFKTLCHRDKNTLKNISKLNFKPILQFLRKNVHQHGASMLAEDIIKKVTGKHLSPKDFLEYLDKKYLGH